VPLRRAAALGDGWIPWEIGFEEFGEAVRVGESVREEHRRRGPFEWIAPLRVGGRATIEELRDEIDRWRDAGATGCHVGFESRSVEEHVDRLGWFADEFVNPDAPL
jgi:hypothetical protein